VDLDQVVKELKIPVPPEVLIGVGTSDDAGVYKIADDLNLVLTADFITPPCDDPRLYGRIAAANSLSDVYAMGGIPKAVLNLCCFPTRGLPKEILSEILQGGLDTTTEAGAALVGGHTVRDDELKYGLAVTGIVRDRHIRANGGGRPGDILILTKPLGTGVVVSGAKGGLIDEAVSRPIFERMAELNKTAAELMNATEGVHGATDVTGFGLAGHAWEMASAGAVGLRFDFGQLPRHAIAEWLIEQGVKTGVTLSNGQAVEEKVVCDPTLSDQQKMLLFDPQTSGGLLIAVAEGEAVGLLTRLRDSGISDAAICGEIFATERPHLEIRP
jgi:selenide,water dikinase